MLVIFDCCFDGLMVLVGWAKRQRAQQNSATFVGHVTIRSFAQPTYPRQNNVDGVA